MNMVGDMRQYAQFQAAQSMPDRRREPAEARRLAPASAPGWRWAR